jgi:hypothetical protein
MILDGDNCRYTQLLTKLNVQGRKYVNYYDTVILLCFLDFKLSTSPENPSEYISCLNGSCCLQDSFYLANSHLFRCVV